MTAAALLPGTGFALTLQSDNADVWEAMQQHRFVSDIIADRLAPDVFRRYLVFEHGFVEAAILIFGHAMLKAPACGCRLGCRDTWTSRLPVAGQGCASPAGRRGAGHR
jgi:hypothetical protein